MRSSCLRIFVLLLACCAILSLCGIVSTAAAVAQAFAVSTDSCCDHETEPVEGAAGSCAFGDCNCSCCPAELLPGGRPLVLSGRPSSPFQSFTEVLSLSGYSSGIDYPPEAS